MKIESISVSRKKGTRKIQVGSANLVVNHGVEGDAHAGAWHRQVSFLSAESIAKTQDQGLDVTFGDFAENIATSGIDWNDIPIGTRIKLGKTAVVEITQRGKKCHNKCAIYYQSGDCIMPKEGVFARVLKGGEVQRGDAVSIVLDSDLIEKKY